MSKPLLIEYRVKPVTRYIVTRFESRENDSGGVRSLGEFPTYQQAYEVGYALAKSEHDQHGWALDDPRMRYPEMIAPESYSIAVKVPPYEVTR